MSRTITDINARPEHEWASLYQKVVILNCLSLPERKERISRRLMDYGQITWSNCGDPVWDFADMIRMPYIYNIVRGFAEDGRLLDMGEDPYSERQIRCWDYSLNLVRVMEKLISWFPDSTGKVLFIEDDVVFHRDPDLIIDTMSEALGYDIALFDGYVAPEQEKFAHIRPIGMPNTRRLLASYGMVWNCDMFHMSFDAMRYYIASMKERLANPDYYTWAVPGNPAVLEAGVHCGKWERNLTRCMAATPLCMQDPDLRKGSIHGDKDEANVIRHRPEDYVTEFL